MEAEAVRLQEARSGKIPWKKWGPYLSERQWGTVRGDYSEGALLQFYLFYGDNFKIECPTGSGNLMNLFEVARELVDRLTRIFLRDQSGRRPVFGGTEKSQTDPHWKDYFLFYEYFHGDNGAGLGAGHQTGWTGLIAKLIEIFGQVDPHELLNAGKGGLMKSEPKK